MKIEGNLVIKSFLRPKLGLVTTQIRNYLILQQSVVNFCIVFRNYSKIRIIRTYIQSILPKIYSNNLVVLKVKFGSFKEEAFL